VWLVVIGAGLFAVYWVFRGKVRAA